MKNIKVSNRLIGEEHWPEISFVDVKGNGQAEKFPLGKTEIDTEKVVQSWDNIAVLKVSPTVPFKFGYIHGDSIHYLKEDIITDPNGEFGVHIGDDDVRFFVIPTSLDQSINLTLVSQTVQSDPKYEKLPLY